MPSKKKPSKTEQAGSSLAVLPPAEPVTLTLMEKAEGAGTALTEYGQNPLELHLPDNLPEADYLAYGLKLGRAMKFAAWRIGDWVNFGMQKFGYKDYAKASGVLGLTEDYIRTCSSVAARVSAELRAVASMEKAKLMLSRKGDKETVEKCFARLEKKTTAELRAMGQSGGSSPKDPFAAPSADEFFTILRKVAKMVNEFPKEKWPLLAAMESAEKTGEVLAAVKSEVSALLDAVREVAATK